jgi:HlyD family secretion protein
MRQLRPLGWVFMLALVGCHAPDPGPLHVMATSTFRAVLVERGEVGSEHELKLSSPISSKVDTLLPEGSVVKPGELVIKLGDVEVMDKWERQRLQARQNKLQIPLTAERGRFDVWRLGVERDNALLDLRIAKLHFEQLSDVRDKTAIVDAAQTLGTLKTERETVLATLPEAKGLHAKGYISDLELATMQKRLAEIEAVAAATRVKLKTLESGPRSEEIALEHLKVEVAASAVAGAERRLRSGTVSARLDLEAAKRTYARASEGEVYRRKMLEGARVVSSAAGVVIYDEIWTGSTLAKLKAGDSVDGGSSMVTIADPAHQVVRSKVNDAAAAQLHGGQPVRCLFDAYPELLVTGRVRTMAPVASTRLDGDLNKLQAVEVLVSLDHADVRLKPGMSANLEFVLDEEPNRLTVPTQALVHDAKGDSVFVYARAAGLRAWWGPVLTRRPVTLGGANERETIVLAGLSAGERVALRPTPEARP